MIDQGFATRANPLIGGRFYSRLHAPVNYLTIDLYRLILIAIAKLKYSGVTIKGLDELLSLGGKAYNIVYVGSQSYTGALMPLPYYFENFPISADIKIEFQETLPANWVWLFQKVFEIFITDPQIIIVNT
jgi:hypothetical protein